jgi:hypothetical protein
VNSSERLLQRLLRGDPFIENPFDENGWDVFIRTILGFGLGPAFFLHIKEFQPIPDGVRKKSRDAYEASLLYKDYAVCCLKEMQPALCAFGRVVIVQGLALCESIYAEPSVRPMGDVDLYFPDASIGKARDVFLQNGFTRLESYANVLCKGEFHIDLHEDLWGASRIRRRKALVPDMTETFTESGLVPGFLIPSASLLAMHCAFHSIKHCFSRMLWHRDLVLLYKAGYFNGLCEGQNGVFPLIALDHIGRKGLIGKTFSGNPLPLYKRKLFQMLFSLPKSPGTGECALALSVPNVGGMLGYFIESFLPRKEILLEMYGNHSYFFLLVCRIFTLVSYVFGMLVWQRRR